MQELHFIPTPVSVTEGDGIFTVTRDITIVLPAAADNDDLFSVKRLQEGIIKYLGFHGSVEKRFTGKQSSSNITLLRADRDATWLPTDMPSLHQQGYHLRVTTDAILLIGADAAGLFYAVETLLQLLDQAGNAVPAIEITDYPALPNRGVMLDISRGKVPTVDTLLHIVDLLASWKINQFQLYIEHTFAWPSHPKIGKGYDPLTPGDIITIDKACAKRHIN
ncbi:MAG TPA: beta-N-acetylhexosaminidase, partial [Armatimonadota bacterium]|nr:beta-N-acetylhexosaminidase [Armatimonadota bacterium]